jgi:hypothetical protein
LSPSAAPALQRPSVTNQMLAEPGYGDPGVYRGAVSGYQQAACGAAPCNGCEGLSGACCCPWYVSVSALVLNRTGANRVWTSNEPPPHEDIQLSSTDIPTAWQWGGEVTIGHRFCCACVPYAIEGTYWSTAPLTGSQEVTNPDPPYTLNTPLNLNALSFGGVDATTWFEGAQAQRIQRHDELQNAEINLVHEQLAWACDSPWDVGWLVGVRYFRFHDYLRVTSVANDGISEAYFSDGITNNFIGAQVGFELAYHLCPSVRLFITPKVGIYNNYIDSDFQAQARAGNGPYVTGTTPYGDFPAHGTRNNVAFLTQIDVGADWQFAQNWSARVGYRVVALTGVGLADDQFPQYMCDIPEMEYVAHSGSLVLHGAFAGLTYCF